MLVNLDAARTSPKVKGTVIVRVNELPAHLRLSVTWDEGIKMAAIMSSPLRLVCRCSSVTRICRGSGRATRNRLATTVLLSQKRRPVSPHPPQRKPPKGAKQDQPFTSRVNRQNLTGQINDWKQILITLIIHHYDDRINL
jgi:predicted Fe-S protein YdhL (DUF1289 family)